MSLDVTFTLEDIVEQLGKYEKQLVDTENAVQQIKGAIAACKHQMQWLAQKQTNLVQKKAEGEKQNAVKEGIEPEGDSSEHQDGDSSGKESKPSSSDCLQQGGEVEKQQQQERVQII